MRRFGETILPSLALSLVIVACGGSGDEEPKVASPEPIAAVEPVAEAMPEGLAIESQVDWLLGRKRYAEALPLLEELAESRRASGGGMPLADVLLGLGIVQSDLGDPQAGLEPLVEAWDIYQDGGASPDQLGAVADALGLACHAAGKFEDAEQALLAAIELRQTASPDNDEPWVSVSRVHLGRLYLTMARYDEAGELFQLASRSADSPQSRSTRQRQLGVYFHTIGSYGRAQEAFTGALEIARSLWGENSEQVAVLIGDLGLSKLRGGDDDGARTDLEFSRQRIMALSEPSPDLVATSANNLAAYHLFAGELEPAAALLVDSEDEVALNNLGSAYHLDGQFREAAMAFTKARTLAEQNLVGHHPLRVQILQNEACLLADSGKSAAALRRATEAGGAALDLLDHLLEFGSEQQKLDFRRTSDPLSPLCSFGAPADEIADMLLRTKGVVLDSILREKAIAGDLVERAAIPDGVTLIDYAVFQKYIGRGEWRQFYGAVVLKDGAPARWVELGDAELISALLSDLGAHMDAAALGGKSDAVLALPAVLEGLYDFCITPLGELGEKLVISPGGELRVVPFAALMKEGKFFSETAGEVDFVFSARESSPRAEPGEDAAWGICAVSEYGGEMGAWPKGRSPISEDVWKKIADLGNLPGVTEELQLLTGEAGFKTLPTREFPLRRALQNPVEILHFSCHGFFLPAQKDDQVGSAMAQSGLVLADAKESLNVIGKEGADRAGVGANDNVLFASEIARLDLGSTRLVTLAACDTGLGVSVAGEGVLGLQRGFQLAGVEQVLMTLWAVGDHALPGFFQEFYAGVKGGQSAAVSIWEAQARNLRSSSETQSLARAVWQFGPFISIGR